MTSWISQEITEQDILGAHICSLGVKLVGTTRKVRCSIVWHNAGTLLRLGRRIDKRFADENDWFVCKDTELVD